MQSHTKHVLFRVYSRGLYSLCSKLDALGLERCGTSKMDFQVISVLCNIMQPNKVSPVGAQSGDDMGFVLILVAANYHQAIVCGGERRYDKGGGRREGKRRRGEEGGERMKERGAGEGGGGRVAILSSAYTCMFHLPCLLPWESSVRDRTARSQT